MIIILFTLIDEFGPLYCFSSSPYQNPYRNLTDLQYEGMENTLASINATFGNTYAQIQDPDWPDPTTPGNTLINPDLVAPFDIAQMAEQYVIGTYYPAFDSFESLLLDPNAVNGFNIALNFDNTASPVITASPPYPGAPTATTGTFNQYNLTDIDPSGDFFGSNPISPAGVIPSASLLPNALSVHQTLNGFISVNATPSGAQTIGTNSYEIFTQAFVTSAGYNIAGVGNTSPFMSIYTAWLNYICPYPVSGSYTETDRAAALIALAVMQGSFNYWCQVYQDCVNNPVNTTTPGASPSGVTNGCIYICNNLNYYNTVNSAHAVGTTGLLQFIDWRQVIQQSIKGALLVLANSFVCSDGSNYQLNMGDQGYLMGASTSAISAGIRNFGTQVVVGITNLGQGVGVKPVKAPDHQMVTKKAQALGAIPQQRRKRWIN